MVVRGAGDDGLLDGRAARGRGYPPMPARQRVRDQSGRGRGAWRRRRAARRRELPTWEALRVDIGAADARRSAFGSCGPATRSCSTGPRGAAERPDPVGRPRRPRRCLRLPRGVAATRRGSARLGRRRRRLDPGRDSGVYAGATAAAARLAPRSRSSSRSRMPATRRGSLPGATSASAAVPSSHAAPVLSPIVE